MTINHHTYRRDKTPLDCSFLSFPPGVSMACTSPFYAASVGCVCCCCCCCLLVADLSMPTTLSRVALRSGVACSRTRTDRPSRLPLRFSMDVLVYSLTGTGICRYPMYTAAPMPPASTSSARMVMRMVRQRVDRRGGCGAPSRGPLGSSSVMRGASDASAIVGTSVRIDRSVIIDFSWVSSCVVSVVSVAPVVSPPLLRSTVLPMSSVLAEAAGGSSALINGRCSASGSSLSSLLLGESCPGGMSALCWYCTLDGEAVAVAVALSTSTVASTSSGG
mmetsp:Transcript_17188/g.48793  ORF Transcript_17188/g.48793 Transcript_17188/m.48793 type:complete len:276 (+) Transcript_17188:1039-1866(+)